MDLRNPTLVDYVRLLGLRRTFQLIFACGGRRYYVPARPEHAGEGQLAAVLTTEELAKLAAQWGGLYIRPPLSRAFCAQFLARVDGLSISKIAQLLRITERGASLALRKPLPPSVAEMLEREACS